jgi:low affinity Fe/Cu permease
MVVQDLALDSPAGLLGGLLLLWFYTAWQSYVIEATRGRLVGLQEIWRETLALDPASTYHPAARAVQAALESSRQRLAHLSLPCLLFAALLPSRQRATACMCLYETISRLPSRRLQQEAISVVETATRYVVLAALRRSLFVWALAPLSLAAFIVWSAHWQLCIALGVPALTSLQLARARLHRRFLVPLVEIVTASPAT